MGLFFPMMLNGCQFDTSTYDYYIRHPTELQYAYSRCQEGQNTDEAQCKIVTQASQDFLQLVEERSRDPEAYGTEIMHLQMALAKNPDTHSEDYQQQLQKLQAMYAVIAATSME